MAGWDNIRKLVELEFTQSREEGKDAAPLDALQKEWEHTHDEAALAVLHEHILAVPMCEDFPFREPSDLEGIRALRPSRDRTTKPAPADLPDRMLGAWLGRSAGCALGKPVEGFMGTHNGLASWERVKTYLTAISPNEWPLRDYIPEHSPASEKTGGSVCRASTREHIAFMETDDDIRYTVLGQVVLREFGTDFLPCNVAHVWLSRLPYCDVCTAETQAYRNMVLRYDTLRHAQRGETAVTQNDAVDWHWVTHHLNPYREWIGAQIRVDSYGYACPGNPERAAELAWRDASISHVKNGIYGAMFCAAMIAEAFVSSDPMQIIEAGLAEIPATSRLYRDMRDTIAICKKHGCDFAAFEDVIRDIYTLLEHYHPVHTNNNAAICLAAILLSGGDFDKGIRFAVMAGLDTDCNGATVGSIVGAMTGGKAAPTHWTARLNDTLNSGIADYHPIGISECARRSLEIVG